MVTSDKILDLIEELRANGQSFCVATILRTADSTSARAGAKAVVTMDGDLHGFVGGGCVTGAVRRAAEGLGYAGRDMVSGAGHDACQICRVAPTAMIFVPCAGGLSHNEAESALPEDLEAGCNVLLHAMLDRAAENAV